ncbi:MAG TPA: TIGR03118 family protein [Acidobacteriaceae bacterium]|nr:TIGR03118 family protein [Acidobacteriaceae bacterium]
MAALSSLLVLQSQACRKIQLAALALCAAVSVIAVPNAFAQASGAYTVTNLVSDGSVPATVTDANFINPWGISVSGTWWISAAGTGYNYVVSTVPAISFKVIVPSAANATANGFPAGSVTTGGATGMILPNGTKASFLFSTLDGTISGWNSKLGTANAISQIAINNSSTGASYPGLAIYNTATASYILAANFGNNAIEVYDGTFKKISLAGNFTDPNLPAGYAPFSVHVLNGAIYVAYAMRTATAPYRTVDAVGNGVVDQYDANGNFVARIATGGNLDSPWGVAIAPSTFGIFGGDILIGNFGNGMINAYDPVHFAYQGQLTDATGKPLQYASLWELLPAGTAVTNSTGVSGGTAGTVYFTAGLAGEQHGLFGAIANSTSGGAPAFGLSASAGTVSEAAGSSATATISIAPTNNFTGTVTFACSGLPAGAQCSFSPAQVTATGSAPSITTLTIESTKSAHNEFPSGARGIFFALLIPYGGVLAIRKRPASSMRVMLLGVVALVSLGALAGCGSDKPVSPVTPSGTSQVTVTATSGSTMQTTTVSLVVH